MTRKENYERSLIKVYNLRDRDLLDALWEIKERPHMWLSVVDIANLNSFVNGWLNCKRDENDEKLMRNFDIFVAKKFNEGNSTAGWCNHIVSHSGEKQSLDLFYDLLKQFVGND